MVKKITAPKTYEPGKGRPREHLAYLNEREMAYLRKINGNNMEFGPRGLPSFPPADAVGSSSKASSSSGQRGAGSNTGPGSGRPGGPSGGTSSSLGGGGQRGAGSNTGSGSGRPGGPSGGTSSNLGGGGQRGAGSNTGPGSGRPGGSSGGASVSRGPASPMSGQGPSFSSPQNAATRNRDVSLKNSLSSQDAFRTVANTPAVRNDGVTGFKAQALGVKPLGDLSIQKIPQKVAAPPTVPRDMEIVRNLDKISADFYKTDPAYQKALSQQVQNVAQSRQNLGLIGGGISPRDTLTSPARTAPSVGMTQSEWNALADKYNPISIGGRLAGGISSLASSVYNDPIGALGQGVNAIGQGINAFGDYAKNSMNTIGAAATSNDPDVQRAAAEKAAEVALNFGLMGSVAGTAVGRPANSLGAFVGARVPSSTEIRKATDVAENMLGKYSPNSLSPADLENLNYDVFNKTKSMVGSDIGGIQNFRGNLGVEIAGGYEPKVSDIRGVQKYGDVFKEDAVTRSVPELKNLNVVSDAARIKEGSMGYYNPYSTIDTYRGIPGKIREVRDMIKDKSNVLEMKPSLSVNSFNNKVLDRLESGTTAQKVAAHEAGIHYMNDLSNRTLYGERNPAGPDYYQRTIMESNPSYSEKTAEDLANKTYWNHIEEQMARKMEDERRRSGSYIRDYNNRITNLSDDELNKAIESYNVRRSLGIE